VTATSQEHEAALEAVLIENASFRSEGVLQQQELEAFRERERDSASKTRLFEQELEALRVREREMQELLWCQYL